MTKIKALLPVWEEGFLDVSSISAAEKVRQQDQGRSQQEQQRPFVVPAAERLDHCLEPADAKQQNPCAAENYSGQGEDRKQRIRGGDARNDYAQ